MLKIDSDAVAGRARGAKLVECDSELLLFFDKEREGCTLNPSARAIWELCDGKRTVVEICRRLGRRFGCPEAAFRQDVEYVVASLVEAGMLELRTGG